MNTMPSGRLLIVTPTLGESALLDATVASVARQPAEIVHLLVAPARRVPELQRRFPNTTVVPDAGRTGGLYGALNAALTVAPEGWDWFSYINDDDLLLPGTSEMLGRHWQAGSRPSVLYGDVDLIDADGQVLCQVTTERAPRWIGPLLQRGISPLMQQGMLVHRDVMRHVRGFDTRYRLCADLDFWLRAYVSGADFRHYPIKVAQFRLRPGQLSGATAVTEREQADIVRRHLPVLRPAWERQWAWWRYRWMNLPRYVRRLQVRGFRTSYEILQEEGVQT